MGTTLNLTFRITKLRSNQPKLLQSQLLVIRDLSQGRLLPQPLATRPIHLTEKLLPEKDLVLQRGLLSSPLQVWFQ